MRSRATLTWRRHDGFASPIDWSRSRHTVATKNTGQIGWRIRRVHHSLILTANNSELETKRNQVERQSQSAVFLLEDNTKLEVIDSNTEGNIPVLNATGNSSASFTNFVARTAKSATVPSINAARHWYSKRISDEELEQRCRELASEIYEFLGAREHNRPMWDDPPDSPSPNIGQKEWRYSEATKSQYRQLFFGRAIALLYAAAERNAYSSEELACLEWSPVIRQNMEETARWLATVGHRP